jgi:arachidonate 15-lipoxygenase
MTSLPQHDHSPSRAEELAERRARYPWDHDYMPPYGLLAMPGVTRTGILNMADFLVGSFAELPVEEQPSMAWLLEKVSVLWPLTYELMQQLPRAEWLTLIEKLKAVLDDSSEVWLRDALSQLQRLALSSLWSSEPPSLEALLRIVGELSLRTIIELALVVEALTAEGEAESEAAMESYQRIADSSLSEPIKRAVIPIQAAFRFVARKSARRLKPPDGVVDDSRLTVELPPFNNIDPTRDDAEFAWRHLAGGNPVCIQAVRDLDGLLARLPLQDERLKEALAAIGAPADRSLAQLADEGRLFYTDYAILDDVPCQDGPESDFFGQPVWVTDTVQRHLPAPLGLFCRRDDGSLRALAVQLGQDPAQYEVFTPSDDPALWRVVKTLYMVADFHHQQLITHLSQGHLWMDGVIIATARQLHTDHPIAALLKPHFTFHLWNDFAGRQMLFVPGGFLEQLLSPSTEGSLEVFRRHCAVFSYQDMHLPSALARRGVADTAALPVYPFRDDGLALWDVIRAYVSEYLSLYYRQPAELAEDHELAAWLAELTSPGGANIRGIPSCAGELTPLVELLTALIFNLSGFHSAVNFTQYDYLARGTYTPPYTAADPRRAREHSWEDCLAGGEVLTSLKLVGYMLVGHRGEAMTDLDFHHFADPAVWPVLARFRGALAALDAALRARNAEGPWAYEYLMPSRVVISPSV